MVSNCSETGLRLIFECIFQQLEAYFTTKDVKSKMKVFGFFIGSLFMAPRLFTNF